MVFFQIYHSQIISPSVQKLPYHHLQIILLIDKLPHLSFTCYPINHSQITLPTVYKLPVIRVLLSLSTNYLTCHPQITLPIPHKLPHQLFTSYPTNHLQITPSIIPSGIARVSLFSKGVETRHYFMLLGLLHIFLTLTAKEGQMF